MASIDRDYVLGVAVQLQTESIAEFEAQVKRQLEEAAGRIQSKPIKAVIQTEFKGMTPAQVQQMTRDYDNLSGAITKSAGTMNDLGAASNKAGKEVASGLSKARAEMRDFFSSATGMSLDAENSDLFGVKNLKTQWEKYKSNVSQMASEHQQINEMLAEQSNVGPLPQVQLFSQTDPGAWEADMRDRIATAKMLKQEMNDLGGPVNFAQNYGIGTDELKEHLNFVEQYAGKVQQLPSYWDHTFSSFKNHLGQWTLMTASITAAYAALGQFQHAYEELSEFQVQGVLFQANQRSAALQGIPTDGTTTQELLSSSIQLATKWGDKVNDVAQDLSLWYKRTGDLNAAMYLTNQALEFQLTTGTDLEDVYKTLTGLSVQAQGQQLGGIFGKETFDLSKTKDVLHEIFAAAVAAGGGMRQLSSSEQELGGNSNGAALLLDAIDKDNAALKMLGSTMTDSIALNAALIQSFGNTGESASEAGEKIGRIAGSLASLSVPGALDKFKKAGMDVSELSTALDNHKNVLFAVLDLYGKMDKEYGANGEQFQMMMSHILGGTRQFEAVQAIYEAYKENLKQIKSAMSDLEQEDQTANQMHDTLRNTVDRTNAEWEAFAMVIGGPVMGALAHLVQGTADSIGGLVKLYGVISAFGDLALGSNPLTVARDTAIIANPLGYENTPQIAVPKGKLDSQGRLVFRGGYVDKNGIVYSGAPQEGPAMFAPGHNPFESTRIGDINGPATQQWLKHYSGAAYQKIPSYDVSLALAGQPIPAMDTFMQSVHGMSKLAQYQYDFNHINDLMRKGESQGNFSGGAGPGSTKADQALNAQADAIQRNLELLSKKDAADQKDVATAKLQLKAMSDKSTGLEALRQAYNREIADRQKDISAVQQGISHYDNLAAHATTGSQQQAFLNKAAQLQAGLQVLQAQLTYLKTAKQVDVNDQIGSLLASKYAPAISATKEAVKNMADGMKLKTETTPDLEALRSRLNENLYIANRLVMTFSHLGDTKDADKFKSWAETLKSDLSTVDTNMESIRQRASSLIDSLSQETTSGEEDLLFPGDKAVSRYGKAMDQIQRKLLEYQKLETEDPGDAALQNAVNQWYAVQTAIAATTFAVDSYQEKLKALENTPTYAAITAVGNYIGSTLTGDVMSAFTSSDNNQVNAIQSQIVALQNEKNLLQGSNSEVERMMLEQRISQLEKDKAGIEDRMKHPGFLKGIEEDMAKAMMKGLTDRLTKDLQDAFTNSILGPNPQNSPQIVATQANTTAIQQLTLAMQDRIGDMSSGASQYGLIGAIAGSSGAQTILSSLPSVSGGGGPTGMSTALAGGAFSLPALSSILSGSSGGGGGSFGVGSGGFGGDTSSFNFATPGGSVPQGIGGGNGSLSFGTGAGTAAMLAGTAFPFFGSSSGSPNSALDATGAASAGSGSGAWSGGFKNAKGKINVAGIMQTLGGASAAVQGYDQGGFAGSLESGLGVYSALTSSLFSGGMATFLSSVAPYAAGAMFLLSMFTPHYNASQNPDMFPDSGYAQGLANAQGIAHTQANGTVYEDPGLKNQLGGMTELQYLNAWYNSYPGGNGLNSEGQQLWNEIGHITGNGKGLGVQGLHQGNVYVAAEPTPGSPQVGESGNWQTVLQDIDNATQQLYTLENQDMTGKGTWISVNSYGVGGGGSASFSPWYSPGLSSSDISAVTAMPYPPLNSSGTITTSPGDPSGGSGGIGGGPGGGVGGGGGGFGVSPMAVTSNVFLNTEVIAQAVNAYNIQRQTSGWAMNY